MYVPVHVRTYAVHEIHVNVVYYYRYYYFIYFTRVFPTDVITSPSAKNSEVVKFKHPVALRNRILDFGLNGEFRYPVHRIRK